MNISLIVYPYKIGNGTGKGVNRYVWELFNHMKKYDVNYNIISCNYSPTTIGKIKNEILMYKRCKVSREEVYHAVVPYGGKFVAVNRKEPLITTIHDMLPYYGFRNNIFKNLYDKLAIKLCVKKSKILIVSSLFVKKEIISIFGVNSKKIRIIPYGLDHSMFFPMKIRRDHKIKKILYIGEITFNKGIDTLLEAFEIIRKTRKDVKLLLGGKRGKDYSKFEELVKKLKIKDYIENIGFVPEKKLPYYYNISDIFVFPSRVGFSLSILEAMACGVPVIAGRSLDAPEFVDDAGILVDPDDPFKLCKEILRVLENKNVRNELSKKGIARAKLFSWDSMAAKTFDLYRELYD